MAKTETVKAGAGKVGAAKWGLGAGKLAVIFISVLVILGAGFFALNLGHGINKTLPSMVNENTPAPSAFVSVYGTTGETATKALAALSASYLSNASQFSVSYSGTIDLQGSGAEKVVSISSPLYINYAGYGPSHKFVINATGVSAFGDAQVTFVNLTNGTFVCTNFNSTAASYGNIDGAFFGNRSIRCESGSEVAGIDMARLSDFDLTQLQNFGIELNYNTDYQSVYQGMPCTYLAGNLSMIGGNGTQAGEGAFGFCISNQDYVPLNFAMYGSGSEGAFSIDFNETAISNSASQAYATTLP